MSSWNNIGVPGAPPTQTEMDLPAPSAPAPADAGMEGDVGKHKNKAKNHNHNGGGSDWKSGGVVYEKCFVSHPPYEIDPENLPGVKIYGGSCCHPAVTDADVYIGFDSGMQLSPRRFPWAEGDEVFFRITDRDVPKDLDEFRRLLDWTAAQLRAGRKVHCGCIGGHGRTGTFLAALRMVMTGDVKAIDHVRTHYCKKTVESATQVDWLHANFGIERAPPTDHGKSFGGGTTYGKGYSTYKPGKTWAPGGSARVVVTATRGTAGSIWRPEL